MAGKPIDQSAMPSRLTPVKQAVLSALGFAVMAFSQVGTSVVAQSGAAVVMSTLALPAQAQTVPGCENPNVDEPDNDGDECYVPPNPPKDNGSCSTDTNGGSQPGQSCGNPVKLTTGNKLQIEVDYAGAGALPANVVRTYNSLANTTGPLGANWSLGYGGHVVLVSATQVNIVKGDAKTLTFNLVAGAWTPDTDVNARLTQTKDASGNTTGWVYRNGSDGTDTFDAQGRLIKSANRAGLAQSLTYDAQGRLATVVDPYGRTLTMTYDAQNRIVTIKDPSARVYTYAYSASNNLSSVTYPDGKVRQYLYENTSFPHALTGLVDEKGIRFATWSYDAQGHAVSSEHAAGVEKVNISYDFVNGVSTVTDALNHTVSYSYETVAGVAHTMHVNQPSSIGGPPNDWDYDDNGNVKSYTDFKGVMSTYTYDLTRNLETSRTEASGTAQQRTITTVWHPTFRLPTQITEPGRVTTFSYDGSGNLLQKSVKDSSSGALRTWTYTYNGSGQVLTATDPNGNVSTLAYDTMGNLQSIKDALGHITQLAYDTDGRLIKATDPNGLVTTYAYDARGRLVTKIEGSLKTSFAYDAAGNLTNVNWPSGYAVTLGYDNAHRLVSLTDGIGNQIKYTLDAMSNRLAEARFNAAGQQVYSHNWTYDDLNRVATDIGANNQTTSLGRDLNGNLTSITDPLGRVRLYGFDALNRVASYTSADHGLTSLGRDALDQINSVTDPRNLVTSYAVDALGSTTQIKSPDSGQAGLTYDALGNVTSRTDAKGQTLLYAYDKLNRVTQIKRGDTQQVLVSYTYDQVDSTHTNGIGHLTSMTDESGSTDWGFDANGHVILRSQTNASRVQKTTYTYDAATGNKLTQTLPSAAKVVFTWGNGHVSSVAVVRAGLNIPLLSSIQYQPFGPIGSWNWGNGVAGGRTYDADGRVTADDVDSSINYDAASRITDATLIGAIAGKRNYAYDDLDRLTALSSADGTQSLTYAYDANGNRTASTNLQQASNYVVDTASNRLLSITGSKPAVFNYDANGSITSDGTNAYTYNPLGRLVQAQATGASAYTYKYNGLGQRVEKINNSVLIDKQFAYDERGHQVGQYSGLNILEQETVYLDDTPIAVLTPTSAAYVKTDYRNTPRQAEFSGGTVQWAWDGQGFGESAPAKTTIAYGLRFPGQYADSETGTHYNYMRNYNPATGRYVQSDPSGLSGGLNTYAYAGGNPITFVDPLGLYCLSSNAINGIGGAIGGLVSGALAGLADGGIPGAIAFAGLGAAAGGASGYLGTNDAGGILAGGALAGATTSGAGIKGGAVGGILGAAVANTLSAAGIQDTVAGAIASTIGGALGGGMSNFLKNEVLEGSAAGGAIGMVGGIAAGLATEAIRAGNDCGCGK
jgi:RHS repeat-associated protein